MTQRQLDCFNRKIDILYDSQRGRNLRELSLKYKMSINMIRTHIKLGMNNFRILQAVDMRFKEDLKKEKRYDYC
jgi:Mor family transcriptional regulator